MARRPNREELVSEFVDNFHGYTLPDSYIDYLEELLNSDIVKARVVPFHTPLLLTSEDEKLLDFIKRYKHLHNNSNLAYAAGVTLLRRYRRLLNQGVVIAPEVYYYCFSADIALCYPEHEGPVIIAVEIGDMQIEKAYLSFKEKKLREVWHFPYYGPEGSFIIWTRGKHWGQSR